MAHHCDFTSVIKVVRGKVVHEVTAKWKKKSAVVYREDENGLAKCRYIFSTSIAGYLVSFPGEKLNYYYGFGTLQEEEKLEDCNAFQVDSKWDNRYDEIQKIIEKRPDLQYLVKKYRGYDPYEFMKLIQKYKKNPHIEFLVELGFNKVANDKRLEKLSKEKITEVCNWVKKNSRYSLITLSQIFFCLKYGVEPCDLWIYQQVHYSFEIGSYLKKKKVPLDDYNDYLLYCKKFGRNLNDKYWRFPSNFQEKYNELLEAEKELERAKMVEKAKCFADISERVESDNNIGGFTVYVPNKIEDVEEQAKVLHQCLVSCDYIGRMTKGKSILVFIKKDEERIATAEINYDKKLLQFYGDESDLNKCKPTDEIRNVFNTWLSTANITRQSEVSAS